MAVAVIASGGQRAAAPRAPTQAAVVHGETCSGRALPRVAPRERRGGAAVVDAALEPRARVGPVVVRDLRGSARSGRTCARQTRSTSSPPRRASRRSAGGAGRRAPRPGTNGTRPLGTTRAGVRPRSSGERSRLVARERARPGVTAARDDPRRDHVHLRVGEVRRAAARASRARDAVAVDAARRARGAPRARPVVARRAAPAARVAAHVSRRRRFARTLAVARRVVDHDHLVGRPARPAAARPSGRGPGSPR